MPHETPDVLVRDCGTVWAFNPLTKAARVWFEENVQSEGWQWLGTSLVVDWHYGPALVEGIAGAGLRLDW